MKKNKTLKSLKAAAAALLEAITEVAEEKETSIEQLLEPVINDPKARVVPLPKISDHSPFKVGTIRNQMKLAFERGELTPWAIDISREGNKAQWMINIQGFEDWLIQKGIDHASDFKKRATKKPKQKKANGVLMPSNTSRLRPVNIRQEKAGYTRAVRG